MIAPELDHHTRQLAEAYAASNDHAGWLVTDLLAFIKQQHDVITLLVKQADASEAQQMERVRLANLPPIPESPPRASVWPWRAPSGVAS